MLPVANPNGNDGELKSKMVASDMDGDAGVAKTESTNAVANLPTSTKRGKKSTKETASVSRAQSLQILRDCIEMIREDGVATDISAFTSKSGKRCALIVVQDVDYADDDFIYVG